MVFGCDQQQEACSGLGCSRNDSGSNLSISNNNGQNLHSTQQQIRLSDDKLLAQELNNLTIGERERIYEEIHGVAKQREEVPEFIEACIENLQKEIADLSRRKRRALDRAFFLKPALQYDKKFLIMFLRADNYDACQAAQRMGRYFTQKLQLFGEEKLGKDITLDDMNEADMECANSGMYHVLHEKDRAGRTILYSNVRRFQCKHWTNMIRFIWYQIMCALEDETAQRYGLVNIADCVKVSQIEPNVVDFLRYGSHMLGDLPFRFAAMHVCYDDVRLKPALSLAQSFWTRYILLRFRVHFGSTIECMYALMTFGIPRKAFPIHPDGTPIQNVHENYLASRRDLEGERERVSLEEKREREVKYKLFDTPAPKDVLLGRGRPFQDYPGNQQLAHLVDAERSRHQNADRTTKKNITIDIVTKVQNLGGRFLQKTDQGWQEVDDQIAREKVSQTFRTKFGEKKTIFPDVLEGSNFLSHRRKRIRYDERL